MDTLYISVQIISPCKMIIYILGIFLKWLNGGKVDEGNAKTRTGTQTCYLVCFRFEVNHYDESAL